jgi:hypothetical protein
MRRYQEDQAADTERLQPTISTRRRVTVIGNLNTTSTSTSATSESYRVIHERSKRHYYKLLTET